MVNINSAPTGHELAQIVPPELLNEIDERRESG